MFSLSFAYGCSVFPAAFAEETTLSPLCSCDILVKIVWPYIARVLYLGSLYPIPFVCVSFFFFFFGKNHNNFITVALQYVLKSGNVKPPSFFFFKMALTIRGELKLTFVHKKVPSYYFPKVHFSTFFFCVKKKK